MRPVEFRTIASFDTAPPAWILRNRLAAAGFQAFVVDEHITEAKRILGIAVGGAKVQLPVDQICEAENYLAKTKAPAIHDDDRLLKTHQAELSTAAPCPQCDGGELVETRLHRKFSLLAMVLLGFPIPVLYRQHHCDFCDHQTATAWDDPVFRKTLDWLLITLFFGAIAFATYRFVRPFD